MATLSAGYTNVHLQDRPVGGDQLTRHIFDLRKKFGAGGTLHRHDGTSGDGGKVLFSNLATAPTGLTGGTTHSKTAHTKVTDRTTRLNLNDWRMGTGTALTFTASQTLPYFANASNVHRIVWPGNSQVKIHQQLQIPDNYDEAADAQALKVVARSTSATQVELDSEMYIVKGGSAIGSDLNPGTAALSTGGSNPQEVSLTLTYATLAQEDLLTIKLFPSGNVTSIAPEVWGAWLEYTGEE